MKNFLKKYISLLLILLLLMGIVPISTVATESSANGIIYVVGNNVATITDYKGNATKLVIPSELNGYKVTSIGDYAFNSCDSLTSITVSEKNKSFSSTEGVLFNKDKTKLICCPTAKKATSYVIPNSVTSIGDYAFSDCDSLTSITIPNSVTSIGECAFSFCDSLTSITIPNSVTSIGECAFYSCDSLTSITVSENNKKYSNKDGVLFNKEKTTLICYPDAKKATSYVIPNSVTSIGDYAFYWCDSLTSITIPNSVTSIGEKAFRVCGSLTSITIPNSVTSIGVSAFEGCYSIKDVYYAGSKIEWDKISIDVRNDYLINAKIHFNSKDVEDTDLVVGEIIIDSVSAVSGQTVKVNVTAKDILKTKSLGLLFDYDTSALEILDGEIKLNGAALSDWDNKDKCFVADFADETNINGVILSLTFKVKEKVEGEYVINCKAVKNGLEQEIPVLAGKIVVKKSNNDNPIENGGHTNNGYFIRKELAFEEEFIFLDVGETYTFNVHKRDAYLQDGGTNAYYNDVIVDANSVNWNTSGNVIKVEAGGKITAVSKGFGLVMVKSKEEGVFSTSCQVFVGEPNELQYTSTYDTQQYYYEGGFYSDKTSVSDCVEIYTLFQNALSETVGILEYKNELINEAEKKGLIKEIKPITITASIDGEGLSFDRKTNQKTYTKVLETLSFGDAMDELLMLFPYNLKVPSSGKHYNVSVTLASESFDTITYKHSVVVENLESKIADEHIDFATSNALYKIFKNNDYGKEMVKIKNNADYKWSKVLETASLKFEDYYKIVFADIMLMMLDNSVQSGDSMLIFIKEWVDNYNKILFDTTAIIAGNYIDIDNDSNLENEIDKLIKKSDYRTEGMKVNDSIRDQVVLKLRDKVSIDKINSAFAKIDKAQQIISVASFGVDVLRDIDNCIDSVSILNTYKSMDNEFKDVINNLYNRIPDSERHLKNAVFHYVNVDSFLGYSTELLDEILDMQGQILLDTFNYAFKKEAMSVICRTAGNLSLKSGTLVSTATAGILISVEAGVFFSDILFDSSGRAEEMSKIVAISDFSPYVVDTLDYYEKRLSSEKNHTSVTQFEYAFALQKATQSYMIQHTIKSLEVAGDSLFSKILGREDDDDGLISEMMVQKQWIDSLKCCSNNNNSPSTVVNQTKVVAIKCPVNVFVYDKSGQEVVRIVNDSKELVAEDITVLIKDRKKYLVLPSNQEYTVKIIATDSGTMEYVITEYDGIQRKKTIKKTNIELEKDREFVGKIPASIDVTPKEYALKYENIIITADEIVENPVTGVELNMDNISMKIGETRRLSAIIEPNNASNTKVKWKSDNPDVVSIDEDGNITALKNGQATITVMTDDWGFTDVCKITVTGPIKSNNNFYCWILIACVIIMAVVLIALIVLKKRRKQLTNK